MDKQNEDFNWFLENYAKLFDEFGECWIVIKDKKILGTIRNLKLL